MGRREYSKGALTRLPKKALLILSISISKNPEFSLKPKPKTKTYGSKKPY
jgi:hypothetical protein